MRLLCVFTAALITGCAQLPGQTINPQLTPVSRLAIAAPVFDQELLLRYRNDQLETIDLISPVPIGRLFTFISTEKRESEFAQQAALRPEELAALMVDDLRQALIVHEMQPIYRALDDEGLARRRNGLLKRIPLSAFGEADALLETAGRVGFTAAGRGTPYQPTVWVTVRVTARDGAVLLQDQVLYNPPQSDARGVLLYPSPDDTFANPQALLDTTRANQALRRATTEVARELVFLLQGQTSHVD